MESTAPQLDAFKSYTTDDQPGKSVYRLFRMAVKESQVRNEKSFIMLHLFLHMKSARNSCVKNENFLLGTPIAHPVEHVKAESLPHPPSF